jgi:hypothetical protein
MFGHRDDLAGHERRRLGNMTSEGVEHRASAWSDGAGMAVDNAGVSQRSRGVDTSLDVSRRIMGMDSFAPIRPG